MKTHRRITAGAARREFVRRQIEEQVQKARRVFSGKARGQYDALVDAVRRRSRLLHPGFYVGRSRPDWFGRLTDALLSLAQFTPRFKRSAEDWTPGESTPMGMFSSLAHHLLAEFPTPPVLLSAWFEGRDFQGERAQRWFVEAGEGKSLREIGFPASLTRKMAFELTRAPADLSVRGGLRWAQVRGLGGSRELARAVAATRLGEEFPAEEFWVSVFQMLAHCQGLDLGRVHDIVESLYARRCEEQVVVIGDETSVSIGPIEPDLCVKGWTLSSLMRRVEAWQAERKAESDATSRRRFEWPATGIQEFAVEADEDTRWTIREIRDSDAIAAEGSAMDHCVASYTRHCLDRTSSIWSLGLEVAGSRLRQRAMTIEVDPSARAIVQARMISNHEPNTHVRGLLQAWARRENLRVEV